jgi:hypothetical protein
MTLKMLIVISREDELLCVMNNIWTNDEHFRTRRSQYCVLYFQCHEAVSALIYAPTNPVVNLAFQVHTNPHPTPTLLSFSAYLTSPSLHSPPRRASPSSPI